MEGKDKSLPLYITYKLIVRLILVSPTRWRAFESPECFFNHSSYISSAWFLEVLSSPQLEVFIWGPGDVLNITKGIYTLTMVWTEGTQDK